MNLQHSILIVMNQWSYLSLHIDFQVNLDLLAMLVELIKFIRPYVTTSLSSNEFLITRRKDI